MNLDAEASLDPSVISPYFTGKDIDQSNFIHEDCTIALFGEYDKRHKEFFQRMMEVDYNSDELSLLIAHLCWKNLDMSRRLGKVLLGFLNKIGDRALAASLIIVQTYLTIQDEF
jgi:hypothetical protein